MNSPFLVVGNWKMQLQGSEAYPLARGIADQVAHMAQVEAWIASPAPFLPLLTPLHDRPRFAFGAQNCYGEARGAFTGEVSVGMIREFGGTFTLLGHSERRSLFGESDALVRRRLDGVLAQGLRVIACLGERVDERDAGRTETVLRAQMDRLLEGVNAAHAPLITLAYEPVWAIGTGVSATSDDIVAAHSFIKSHLATFPVGTVSPAGEEVRVLYGGSVSKENVKEIVAVPEVGGVLVGSKSLSLSEFCPLLVAGEDRSL